MIIIGLVLYIAWRVVRAKCVKCWCPEDSDGSVGAVLGEKAADFATKSLSKLAGREGYAVVLFLELTPCIL